MWIILSRDGLILLVTLFPLKVRLTLGGSDVGLIGEVVVSIVFAITMVFDGFTVLLYWVRWVICLKVRQTCGGY